jgi:prepilin-type N-terminal cleavage/methylation domain-containing protein
MRAHLRSWSFGRRSSAGFTLVEMLVTLVIFALVAVTVTLVLMNSAKSKQRTTQRIESEQGARAAVDLMARDIRTAGYGADTDNAPPQPAIAYVDSREILLSENQLPYPDPTTAAPLAYNRPVIPKPFPLNATTYTPPMRYATGAELIRYTLDVNNDGVVDANDVASAEGADAAATPNPNDYVLVRQVYGDNTGGVAGNNGGTTERVALVRRPGDAGVPAMFNVYMKGFNTPWDWANGPVPATQLQNIQRVELQVTATASRPDARGQFAQTTISTQVNAARSVPDFTASTVQVSGYVYNDLNQNHSMDGSDVGIAGATVHMGTYVAYTNATGQYQLRAPAGMYTLKHKSAMGYGSFDYPDTFNLALVDVALTRSFADTARQGGLVNIYAYEDKNGSGAQDTGELSLSGMKFSITPGTPEAPTGVTDVSGNVSLFTGVGGFSVTAIKPDTLTVTEDLRVARYHDERRLGLGRFGFFNQAVGHITGKVYVDANRNGNFDSGELGMASVWVGVSKDGGINVAAYGYTDASGNYDITAPVNDPPHTDAYAVYTIPAVGLLPDHVDGDQRPVAADVADAQQQELRHGELPDHHAQREPRAVAGRDGPDREGLERRPHRLATHDIDLILGADAGGTDNVSVWFNQYPTKQLFTASPSDPTGYTRLAPNSVMAMAVDTLDKKDLGRPDLVTGTKFTAGGNFFVWFTQGTSNNEGYLPSNYNTGRNYRRRTTATCRPWSRSDCGGGNMPDILVGTKGATAGQGSLEVW